MTETLYGGDDRDARSPQSHEADGVISRYAIGGAIAALNYIELASTEDLDVFISLDEVPGVRPSGLLTLTPILNYLFAKGFTTFQKEGILIAGWPVQFLPVASDLEAEGLARAENLDLETALGHVPTRVLRPEYLIANASKSAEPKIYCASHIFLMRMPLNFSCWVNFCGGMKCGRNGRRFARALVSPILLAYDLNMADQDKRP